MFLGVDDGKVAIFAANSSASVVSLQGVTDITDGGWHHIVATSLNGVWRVYVDGDLEGELYGTAGNFAAMNTTPFMLGANPSYYANDTDGDVREASLWNIAKDEDDVAADHSDYSGYTGAESGLVGYWKVNEGTNIYVNDLATVPHTLTLSSAPDPNWATEDAYAYYVADVKQYTDYTPYGVQMEGRNGGDDFRYGFQGQEEDDEIKGEGNSLNFKYRMHDPRLGRFFAVDPLAPNYPHNSPYAFSENSVIAFVELEGLERYYAADGSLLGQVGNDYSIRIIDCADLGKRYYRNIIASANYSYPSGESTGAELWADFLFNKSVSLDHATVNSNTRGRIYDDIYTDAGGSLNNLASGKISILAGAEANTAYGDKHVDYTVIMSRGIGPQNLTETVTVWLAKSVKAMTLAGRDILVIQPETTNYWDLYAILWHEEQHRNGRYGSGIYEEFKVHYETTQQSWYINTTERYQLSNLGSMLTYLIEQAEEVEKYEKYLPANSASYTQEGFNELYNDYLQNVSKFESAVKQYETNTGKTYETNYSVYTPNN